MRKKACAAVALMMAGALAACGGGGSMPSATITGKVADGYLRGAEVFLDMNGNYQWDSGEPKTTSGPGGAYTLSGPAGHMGRFPVVARAMAGVTVDEDTDAPVASGYVMSAPAGAAGFVSPMSSLVREKMAANPGMTMNEAMTQLRNQMNMPSDVDMLGDYVAGSRSGQHRAHYQSVHDTARQMAEAMAGQSSLVMNGGVVHLDRYRAMMGEINRSTPEIADNAANGLGMESAAMTAMRDRMRSRLQNTPSGGGFMNYSGMFRNMTSHASFWNYSGGTWRPGGGMMGSGMMGGGMR